MTAHNIPDKRFLDAQIALLLETPDDDLDELLVAAGFDPKELAMRGENAIAAARAHIAQAAKASATLASLSVARQREVAIALGIQRSVLAAVTERRAFADSVPEGFVRRLAVLVESTFEGLRLALRGPLMAGAAAHKADKAPVAPKQVPFAQILKDAQMSDDQIATFLRDNA